MPLQWGIDKLYTLSTALKKRIFIKRGQEWPNIKAVNPRYHEKYSVL